VTDPLDADERWFAHLLASIPAPVSLDSWTPAVTPVARPRRRRRSRVTPLAIALVVAVLVGMVGAGLGLILPRHGGGNPAATATAVIPGMPPGRSDPAMAGDPAHHHAVLFGGGGAGGLLGDTWSWDGHRWSREILPSGPAARASAAMAADPGGGVVLFGGAGTQGLLADTWRWDGRAWTPQHPRTAPPRSALTLMAEDTTAGRTLLVVADPIPAAPVSTWSWDGHDWARRTTATAPPSCPSVMAADPAGHRVVLLTGRSCPATSAGATWTWDGRAWTQLHPATSPPAQVHPALGAGGGRLTLFSAEPDAAHGCAARFTWTWDGATWTPHTLPVSPPASGAAATDPVSGALLLLTPSGETWRWTGSAWELGEATPPQNAPAATAWTERIPPSCPPARTGAAMVTDDARHQVLLFGGSASPLGQVPPALGDTWIWDGAAWSERHPNPAPPARTGAVAAYDAARSVVVLFGGEGLDDKGAPVAFDATWTWNGSAWKRLAPKTAPPGLPLASMAWDPGGRSVILVTSTTPQAAQTWSWDGAAWTQLHPHTTPPQGSLVAAPDLGGLLLVSPTGADGQPSTWSWAGADWHRLGVPGTPALTGAAVAYQAAAHRVVLFAGDCPTGHCPSDATWVFDGRAWTQVPSASTPLPRSGAALAPDPNHPGLVLFGGTSFLQLFRDTWEFG
jgi:hypothetical protein